MASSDELACVYAALILADDQVAITVSTHRRYDVSVKSFIWDLMYMFVTSLTLWWLS